MNSPTHNREPFPAHTAIYVETGAVLRVEAFIMRAVTIKGRCYDIAPSGKWNQQAEP